MSKTLAFRPRQVSLPPDEGSWHGDVKSFELRVLNGEAEVRDAVVLRHRAYAALGYELEDSAANAQIGSMSFRPRCYSVPTIMGVLSEPCACASATLGIRSRHCRARRIIPRSKT